MSFTVATRPSTPSSDSSSWMREAVSRIAAIEARSRWLAQITVEMPAWR
jgi:hypothetical protein